MSTTVGTATEILSFQVETAVERLDALRVHFDEPSVAEIAAVIINMTVWTRLTLPRGAIPDADEALRL